MTEQEWLEGNDVRGMLRCLGSRLSERKSLLFTVYCCRRIWERFTDPRTRQVVECAERRAEGLATQEELRRAYENAGEAWREAMTAADSAEREAKTAGANKYAYPAYVQARKNAWGADAGKRFFYTGVQLADEVSASIRGFAGDVSMMAFFAVSPKDNPERMWQGQLLNEMFGNPFHPVTLASAWPTPTVVELAQSIYDNRAFDRLPILADALHDAGCDNDGILNHCRGPGPHVRGCWVVDLVLGKQ
jgi:hypothetical protein